jgi:putative transcriptional regulator
MPIIYNIDIIQELKNKGYTRTRIKEEKLLGERALTSIRHNQPIGWVTIEKLCELLDCQPGDLISYQK